MSLTADLHCEIREVGGHWWPVATFDIESARSFRLSLQGAGLADRGLPPDVSDVLRDRYDEQVTANPREVCGATFITMQELALLLNAALWLTTEERERIPPHTYEEYAETDFIRAWHAFAQAHEAHERVVRLVMRFEINCRKPDHPSIANSQNFDPATHPQSHSIGAYKIKEEFRCDAFYRQEPTMA
ncbi:hypothetical protein [Deinococcus sp. 6GRE01]|uniref:hypothetical protein n=1 Tax=Deinococcus sp. 6GRE01 TaxID=2745873 RepID=UPI001E544106|nr:hypothetical protein [Deinococcus sp. 6GRE01]MCD0157110.1 hypothetical protein [Deinococcus sp. 6GRE01]